MAFNIIMSYRNLSTLRRVINPMQTFHGRVKQHIGPKGVNGGTQIMDLGSGKLNDLQIWAKNKIRNVWAVEIDPVSISLGEKKYNRLKKTRKLPNVHYINVNLNTTDITTHKSLSHLRHKMDHIVCNFAFHYFLKNKATINNIFKIIDFFLKSGGSFRMTTLNGNKVWKLLKNKKIWKQVSNKLEYFKIRRSYMPSTSIKPFGEAIDVFVISIGKWHKEYLMNSKFIIEKFESIGYSLDTMKMFGEFMTLPFLKNIKLSIYEKKYSELNMYMKFIKK